MPSTATASYTRTAKILHWLIALAIVFMLALGWSFDFVPKGETKAFMYQLHKSIGIMILLLSVLRVIWRLLHTAPPLPATLSRVEQKIVHVVHGLLYLGMFALPLSGWAMSSTGPYPIVLFGLVPWPAMPILPDLDNRKEIGALLAEFHGTAALILAVLAAGHLAAALKHHFIAKDDSLLAMAPRCSAGFLNKLRGK